MAVFQIKTHQLVVRFSEEQESIVARSDLRLARSEVSEIVIQAYGGESAPFGREYLIPRPFDPRLILQIAPAVAEAAMKSGVATRPIEDLAAYRAVARVVRLLLNGTTRPGRRRPRPGASRRSGRAAIAPRQNRPWARDSSRWRMNSS